jgi:drug/metabolite transporter (DMT)-like permease
MDKRATLPDYCVKCGIPANGSRLRKRLSWHHPALALLILVGVLIYVIVALIVRKSAVVEISLCEDHLRRHRTAAIVTWLVFLVGMGFIVLAIAKESGGSALFGIFLVFVSAILAMTWAKVVNVKKIDDYYVWLRGINESFLVMLPSLNK